MIQKRIAMISYHTCPLAAEEGKETGGMNIYVLHTAQELGKLGYTIDIFTRSQNPNQTCIVKISDNVRVIHIKAGPESYILPNTEQNKKDFIAYIAEFVTNMKIFQEKEQLTYDLIDAHYYLSGLVGMQFNNQLPMMISFHTLALMKNLISRNGLSEQDQERVKAEALLTKKVQKIIAPSDNEKNYLQYLYQASNDKIEVILPGVDTSLFRPLDKVASKHKIEAELDHKMILFVGRIDPVKGLDVLLYAMKILFAKHPNIKACLWIVGGDVSQSPDQWSSELQKLDQLRELLGLDTTVKFIGQKPQQELPLYYNAADLVVMPSHYESFGMTALEAMSCGTPIITTNVTGVSELLDEVCQRHITTANNPLLLADTIIDVLSHDHADEAKEMQEMIQEYDWQHVAQKIADVYKKLVS